ncbi:MAG: hypothetical protein NG740_03080 [Omnitrophica bacterium]|nr:hypothetical protein [Candidatus Omnitrophota bacterium]
MQNVNWLSLIGISLAIFGTAICTMNSLGWLSHFSIFKDIDYAMGKIKNITVGAKKTKKVNDTTIETKDIKIGLLTTGEKGFKKLYNIIASNLAVELPQGKLVGIKNEEKLTYGNKTRRLSLFNSVYLIYRDRKPFLLASEVIIDEWIRTYKFRYFLSWGFGLIFVGFLLRFLSHFCR